LLLASTLLWFPTSARALGFYFETVAATATSLCAAPCFQVRMFLEDPTRDVEIQALQFDVDVSGGVVVANLPIPPASNSNAQAGNVNVEDEDGNVFVVPWPLSATVGASPTTGFDALAVLAGHVPFDLQAFADLRAAGAACGPAVICTISLNGLAANRLYLGRFNVTLTGAPVFVRVGQITGLVMEGVPLPPELLQQDGASCDLSSGACRTEGEGGHSPVGEPVPEPRNTLALLTALGVLALVRRQRSRGLAAILVLAAGAAGAEPPALIQYQGVVLAPDGSPRPGPVDLEIAILDAPVQGNEVYRERHPQVPLVDGFFTISLGGGQDRVPAALSPEVFTGPGTRWLQLTVDGEVIAPRQQFLSVPYAFEAASATQLQGRSLAQVVEAPGPLSGYEQISASASGPSLDASCPAGKVAVGGGCDCSGATTESRPVGGFNSWHCECSTAAGNRAWVLCAFAGDGVCGNGVRDGAEQCDSASASACADGRCGAGCQCMCGNGILEAPEQCDRTASSACANGACGADCRCSCGNGQLDSGEACDGALAQSCPAGSSGCRLNCSCSICGDGIIDPAEQCDGSAAGNCGSGGCGSDCRCTCGNGALDSGEQCEGTDLQRCPAGSTGCSAGCSCLRCGDAVCAAPENASNCPADCSRSYRRCGSGCDPGLFCDAGFCTDSCFNTCDLDPAFEERCDRNPSEAFGSCVALCKLDPASSRYVCPGNLVCSDPVSGGTCR
jgi:hypothetical protein